MKREITVVELCRSFPEEFITIWNEINRLEYEEQPNYKLIKELLLQAMQEGKSGTHRYDWEKLPRYQILQLTPLDLNMGPASNEESELHVEELEKTVVKRGCCNVS